jgi:hypothetical protein
LKSKVVIVLAMNVLLATLLIGAFLAQPVKANGDTPMACGGINAALTEPPYGTFYLNIDVCKALDDGDPLLDYYFYQIAYGSGMTCCITPGYCLTYQGDEWSGSDWENAYHAEIFWGVYGTFPLTWAPTTTTGGYSGSSCYAEVNINYPPSIGVNFGFSTSYSTSWLAVEDHSYLPDSRVGWAHLFNFADDQPPGEPSRNTHLSTPAFVVATFQNLPAMTFADFYHRYAHKDWYGNNPPILIWYYSPEFCSDSWLVTGYYSE